MSEYLRRTFAPDSLEIREGRTILGLAVPFNSPTDINDSYGSYREQFAPGAFSRTISERGAQRVKLLLQHDSAKLPIGRAASLTETPEGLRAELAVSKTPDGDTALELVRDGALDGLSVGFQPINQSTGNDGIVTRTEVKLLEISLTGFPAYDNARVAAVRSTITPPANATRARVAMALNTFRKVRTMTDNAAPRELVERSERLAGELDRALADTITPPTQEWIDRHTEQLDYATRQLRAHADANTPAMIEHREFVSRTTDVVESSKRGRELWLPSLGQYRELASEQRAVGTTGAFIPVEYSSSFFDQLRKNVSVLAANPVVIPIDHAGSLKVPAITGSVTVIGTAEAGTFAPSDPTLANITLDPKKFGALTLVNSEAIDDSNPQLREIVANALVKDLAVELDKQLITGSGTGSNLTGIRNVSGVTAGPSLGAAGTALTLDHLADTVAAAETANLDPSRMAWFLHSRTWGSIRKLKDSQARPLVSIDPAMGMRPSLFGIPVHVSNNLSIAETVGASTDCSSLLLVDMSQIVVGVSRQIEVVMSTDYAFNTDQVALRATCRYDIGAPQPTAIVVTPGVRE